MREALAEFEIPVLASTIHQRVAFAETAAQGATVLETDPNGVASGEIKCVVAEVEGLL